MPIACHGSRLYPKMSSSLPTHQGLHSPVIFEENTAKKGEQDEFIDGQMKDQSEEIPAQRADLEGYPQWASRPAFYTAQSLALNGCVDDEHKSYEGVNSNFMTCAGPTSVTRSESENVLPIGHDGSPHLQPELRLARQQPHAGVNSSSEEETSESTDM